MRETPHFGEFSTFHGCNTLQHITRHCRTLQHIATHCNTSSVGDTSFWRAFHFSSCSALACCSVLQCVAVCCSLLQSVAACCSVLQRVAVVAVCCSVLPCVAVCCTHESFSSQVGLPVQMYLVGLPVKMCCSVLQHVATSCSVLQCVARVHDSVCRFVRLLKCVAACCSMLQRVSLHYSVLQ